MADPADALTAREDASTAFESLFVALGAVALLVGGIGIANVMVIGVLERRGEIGLRRAMGARRLHVGVQFVTEAATLSLSGGIAGAVVGALAVSLYAGVRHWSASGAAGPARGCGRPGSRRRRRWGAVPGLARFAPQPGRGAALGLSSRPGRP